MVNTNTQLIIFIIINYDLSNSEVLQSLLKGSIGMDSTFFIISDEQFY